MSSIPAKKKESCLKGGLTGGYNSTRPRFDQRPILEKRTVIPYIRGVL